MNPLSSLLGRITLPLVMLAPAAQAQETDEQTADFGDLDTLEITAELPESQRSNQITAFKTGTPLIDVPRSVTVVTSDQIDELNIDSIGDIVDYTPGVTTSQGEGHRDAVVFRGMRSTADFFVDGVRDDVQYFRPLYNVEQVEILRGPSALFFGRGGTGGVINRVLKKAEIGHDFGEINGRINTFGGYESQFDYNKHLTDKSALRLNLFYENLQNHRDFFDGERIGINPTLKLQLSDDTTLDLSYEYLNFKRFIDRGIPSAANGNPATFLAGTTFGDSQLNETTLEAQTVRAAIKHQISDNWKANLTGFFGTYDKVYSNYFPSDFDQATNQVEIDGYIDSTDRQNTIISGDVIGEFGTWFLDHKLILGAEYIHTSSDQDRFNNVFESNGDDQQFFDARDFRITNGVVLDRAGNAIDRGSFTDINDDTRVTIDSYSFYLQDEIAVTEKLDLILGARFDSFDIEVFNAVTNQTLSRQDDQVSPRLGLILKPVENLSIYGSYSETFLPRSGEQFADINPPNNALDPDEFSNVEAGIKWDIFDDLSLTVAGFRVESSSPQVSDADAGALDIIDTDTFGIEAQIKGQITDRWGISAGYSYLDGEQVDEFGDTGLDPREQPEHTFSIWNSIAVTDKFGIGFGVIYQDESFSDNANTNTLPAYVRFDAAAHYNISDTLRFQINIENLFDRDYFPNSHTANNISVGAPFNATFKLTKTF